MRLLLDTHVLFWWLTEASELPDAMREVIRSRDNIAYVSAGSAWEIATKVRTGKWPEAATLVPGIEDTILTAGFEPLAITVAHAEHAGQLDWPHRDPFDRLLAAHAQLEDLTLLSIDPAFGSLRSLRLL